MVFCDTHGSVNAGEFLDKKYILVHKSEKINKSKGYILQVEDLMFRH
jgi:hypothetical protein